MAYENGLLDLTFQASGNDVSTDNDQFRFVKFGETAPQVVKAHAGERILGISQATAKTTEGLEVRLVGASKLRLGGTVKAGNNIKSDASGDGVLDLHTANIGAIALDDGVSGDVIPVLIERSNNLS